MANHRFPTSVSEVTAARVRWDEHASRCVDCHRALLFADKATRGDFCDEGKALFAEFNKVAKKYR